MVFNHPALTEDERSALDHADRLDSTANAIERFCSEFGTDLAHWALQQVSLRRSASSRFTEAGKMLFTRSALEQASHPEIAKYRAAQFPAGEWIVDLTCGIGSDLIGLAASSPAIGVDLDAERLRCCSHNLEVLGRTALLHLADSLEIVWDFAFACADPSRRVAGRRTRNLEEFSPDPRELSARMKHLKLGCLKLSPMLADEELRALGNRLEFLSFGSECREATIWTGTEAEPGCFAVLVESSERLEAGGTLPTGDCSSWLYEADPAAIRAHALGTLAIANGLRGLHESNGYLTAGHLVESPWLRTFEVVADCKADPKAIRAKLRDIDARVVATKSRVRGLDVPRFQQSIAAEGDLALIAVAYPVGKGFRVALTLAV